MTSIPKVASRGKYKIGDQVRISKYKRHFEKGYTPNWTEEIFVVDKIVPGQLADGRLEGDPITYKLKDLNGEEVLGLFYEGDQSLAKQVILRIEKGIKRSGSKLYVKWSGYPDSFNSWINKKRYSIL